MKLNVIITGVTGMIGEGVMHECLNHPLVESVLALTRRPTGMVHNKLKEVVIPDFFNLTPYTIQLSGYNACFFCMGVSSVGLQEEEYRHLTYELTINMASILAKLNSEMTFCYVSGKYTDSSEQGRMMWARVKGKTENDLMKLPFKGVFAFRPGYIYPTPGMKHTLKHYKYHAWLYPVLRVIAPASVSTLKEIGLAMVHVSLHGYDKQVLEVNDIIIAAKLESNF